MASEHYSIKDLEKLSGIKAHTIRIWEKRYGIIHPRRTGTNIRYYSNDDLKKLLNISLLIRLGFKISAISQMPPQQIAEKVSATSVTGAVTGVEDDLLLSLIDMDETRFNKAFGALLRYHGFEAAVTKVVFPFFNRIGIMWQAGAINPAQEHFFSNLLRNKIIAAMETLNPPEKTKKEIALLFLPEEELHEIGLLFYNYLLRQRGYKTIYLGQAVPIDSLARIMETVRPAYIVTSVTNPATRQDILTFSKHISGLAPEAGIFFAGPLIKDLRPQLPGNCYLIEDLLQLLQVDH